MKLSQKRKIMQFIKNIDPEIKVKFQKGQLECDPENETIYIGKKNTKAEDDLFNEYVQKLEPKCKYNSYIMGILHEIGHIMTYTEKDDDDRTEQYSLMQVAYWTGLMTAEELNQQYFEIPLEKNATLWGINYAMKNQKIMQKFNRLIYK